MKLLPAMLELLLDELELDELELSEEAGVVRVTVDPAVEGFGLLARLVAVPILLTVCCSALEVLPA